MSTVKLLNHVSAVKLFVAAGSAVLNLIQDDIIPFPFLANKLGAHCIDHRTRILEPCKSNHMLKTEDL